MSQNLSVVSEEVLPPDALGGCSYFVDNLLAGPSRASFDEHVKARASYYESSDDESRASYAAFDSVRGAESVHFWGIEDWKSRLALAFLCAQYQGSFDQARIVMNDLPAGQHFVGACCGYPMLVKANAKRHELTRPEIEQGAAFWKAFTSSDPATVFALASWSLLPKPDRFADYLTAHAPRERRGRKRLSEIDACLLAAAAEAPVGMVDLFVSSKPRHRRATRLAHCGGDLTLARRLEAWTQWPVGGPALVHAGEVPKHSLGAKYGLTTRGQSLLAELDTIESAPPYVIGGTTMYDPTNPFYVTT